MQFTWSGNYISQVTAPGNKIYTYTYSGNNLAQVTYPNGAGSKTYHYESSAHPSKITGVSLDGTRYSTNSYDAIGRVTSSGLLNGVKESTFTYTVSNGDIVAAKQTNAKGTQTTFNYQKLNGTTKLVSTDRPATSACSSATAQTVYNTDGYPIEKKDWEGNSVKFAYNKAGQVLSKITKDNKLYHYSRNSDNQITQIDMFDSAPSSCVAGTFCAAGSSTKLSSTTNTYYASSHAAKRRLKSITMTQYAYLISKELLITPTPSQAPK